MHRSLVFICLIALAMGPVYPTAAQEAEPWWSRTSRSWDDTVMEWIEPHLYLTYTLGDATTDPAELAVGHHDPTREQGTVQGLELGASLRAGDYLHGFATYNLSYGAEEEWDGEWEEAFLKLIYPDVAHVRGGRMLTRFGDFNAKHLHSWDTVDMPLVIGRFLGDDGLILDGGDVTGTLNTGPLTTTLVLGYGDRPPHDEHGHAEEADRDEVEEEGHRHAGEEALLQQDVGTARLFFRYVPHDFMRYVLGFSGAVGDTETGMDSSVLGVDFSLTWRENGLEPGGRAMRWTTEALFRDFDAEAGHEHEEEAHGEAEEEEHHGVRGHEEAGVYSTLVYSHNEHLDAGLRGGWVEGVKALELEERWRVSPILSYWMDPARHYQVRVQYNYDDLEAGEEHSVWVQLQAGFGAGSEVR